MTLKTRIILMLLPPLLLMAAVGIAGMALLARLGGRAERILRENYDSVIAMERLNEALERIDSSFQFALIGRKDAKGRYDANWDGYRKALEVERRNVTLPGEREAVAGLDDLTRVYRKQGDDFFLPDNPDRREAYFGREGRPPGLNHTFNDIKDVSGRIRRMNQQNMEDAGRDARETASSSMFWFGGGLALAAVLAPAAAAWMVRSVLRPITAMTESAEAIGAGNLDQVLPVVSSDELGRLAEAFNTMAGKLRRHRKSQTAKLLRAQQTSQATIDSFPDPVLVLDSAGRIEMANPAARRISGPAPADEPPAGTAWQPPDALREPLAKALRGEADHLPQGFEKVLTSASGGQERAYLPRILAIRDADGAGLGAAVVLADVTRFRLLDRIKSDLVATASHELKTPLTSLRMAVHLLLEEAVGPLTPKQTELLVDARENSERLLATINNLLNLTKLESGRELLELRPTAPADLLRTAADEIRPKAESRSLSVTVEAPTDLPPVNVDPPRFGVAMRNLLENAVTYTDAGGRIELKAAAGDGDVVLTVSDTGVGIPPEHLPHVFHRFFRVPDQSRGGGTGLGLAIVREVVAVHGGTIACESRVGFGTTFRMTLPTVAGDGRARPPMEAGHD